MSLKLLSLNIEGDNHFDVLLPFVLKEQPDVACFNEVFEGDVAFLKHSLGMDGFFVAAVALRTPNRFRLSPRGNMGTLILARQAIVSTHVDYYVGVPEKIPELTNEKNNAANRLLVWADISVDDEVFTIVSTHFTITENGMVTQEQRENLKKMLGLLGKRKEFVFCGDFNAPRGREIFDTLATHYTDNIPANVETTLDKNLHRSENLPDFVVDGLFTTSSYKAYDVRVVCGVSDHCAVIATIKKE